MQFYQLCMNRFQFFFFVLVKSRTSVKNLLSKKLISHTNILMQWVPFLRVTLSFDFWLKVGGAFLQGGKKFTVQISLLLNYYIIEWINSSNKFTILFAKLNSLHTLVIIWWLKLKLYWILPASPRICFIRRTFFS